ncbi:LysR substrate-binding domain-containing protein [Lacibacterium aquatile]|uniref:LysR substrate-binding domain-containing protein n=1 Tax=Lacibacterium aquatile TaxID=1168082 RepID=A0ABW5DWN7_9PROT
MRPLDPDLLRTFLAIVEDGSFRAAAERVGRTQSAVSMQIARLEEAAGHALFTRERPWPRLTPKGELLLGYARRLLALQEEAVTALSGTTARGNVRFGIPDDYAGGILPMILERFAADQPQIDLELRCETSDRLTALIAAGDLDVALVSQVPGGSPGQFFRREPLVWATSLRRPALGREPMPLAVFQPDCQARQWAVAALSEAGIEHRIAYSSPNLAALLAVAEAGLAVAALPLSSLTDRLKILRNLPPLPDLTLGILTARTLTPAAHALCRSILEGGAADAA